MMNSEWSHLVDVSSFFLFEATGDSESNSDSGHDVSEIDDDDAESCCSGPCGSMDEDNNEDDNGNYYGLDDDDDDDDEEYYPNQGNDESPPEEVMMGYKQEPPARATVDANENGELLVLNEMEKKNKLFWETCLAS